LAHDSTTADRSPPARGRHRFRREDLGRFVRFCVIGGSSALASLLAMYLLTDVAHLHYLVSTVIVFLGANACTYLASRHFAFHGTRVRHVHGVPRYFAIAGASLVFNTGAMAALVSGLGMPYLIAAALLAVVNAPVNFVLHHVLTFRLGR
jgi:putative flippase GtrA